MLYSPFSDSMVDWLSRDRVTAVLAANVQFESGTAYVHSGTGTLVLGDINGDMLRVGRDRMTDRGFVRGFEYVQCNAERLPFPDASFDLVVLMHALTYSAKPAQAVAEAARVLRSGGLLVVADFDRHTQERMRLDYGDLWLGFDEATMARLLHAASFEVVSTTRYPVEQGLALNLTLARRL